MSICDSDYCTANTAMIMDMIQLNTWRMIQSTSKWMVLLELDTIHRMWKNDGKHSALYNAAEAGNLEKVQELISLTNVTTEEKGTDSSPESKKQ